MLKYNKIVICGAARTGTTLLQSMMRCFRETLVIPGEVPGIWLPPINNFAEAVVVTKAPHDIVSAQIILLMHPHTLIIVMQRDPRDILCSRVGADYGYRIYKPYYLDRLITAINELPMIAGNWPENTSRVRYEQLVNDPIKVQGGIEQVVGLSSHTPFWDHDKLLNYPELNDQIGPRPVTASSVGAWHRPENREWMRELLHSEKTTYRPGMLAELVISEGYEADDSWMKEILDD